MPLRISAHTFDEFPRRTKDQNTLKRYADMIERGSQEGIAEELDYENVKERYLTAVKAIG